MTDELDLVSQVGELQDREDSELIARWLQGILNTIANASVTEHSSLDKYLLI